MGIRRAAGSWTGDLEERRVGVGRKKHRLMGLLVRRGNVVWVEEEGVGLSILCNIRKALVCRLGKR